MGTQSFRDLLKVGESIHVIVAVTPNHTKRRPGKILEIMRGACRVRLEDEKRERTVPFAELELPETASKPRPSSDQAAIARTLHPQPLRAKVVEIAEQKPEPRRERHLAPVPPGYEPISARPVDVPLPPRHEPISARPALSPIRTGSGAGATNLQAWLDMGREVKEELTHAIAEMMQKRRGLFAEKEAIEKEIEETDVEIGEFRRQEELLKLLEKKA